MDRYFHRGIIFIWIVTFESIIFAYKLIGHIAKGCYICTGCYICWVGIDLVTGCYIHMGATIKWVVTIQLLFSAYGMVK